MEILIDLSKFLLPNVANSNSQQHSFRFKHKLDAHSLSAGKKLDFFMKLKLSHVLNIRNQFYKQQSIATCATNPVVTMMAFSSQIVMSH